MSAKKVKHGMRLAAGGEYSLIHVDPRLVKRLGELRELLATEPGRLDVRLELISRYAIIVELGMAEVGRAIDRGDDLFDTPVIAKLATYMNALQSAIDKFPDPLDEAIDVEAVLTSAREKLDEVEDGKN